VRRLCGTCQSNKKLVVTKAPNISNTRRRERRTSFGTCTLRLLLLDEEQSAPSTIGGSSTTSLTCCASSFRFSPFSSSFFWKLSFFLDLRFLTLVDDEDDEEDDENNKGFFFWLTLTEISNETAFSLVDLKEFHFFSCARFAETAIFSE
jgi:hypothetical protein